MNGTLYFDRREMLLRSEILNLTKIKEESEIVANETLPFTVIYPIKYSYEQELTVNETPSITRSYSESLIWQKRRICQLPGRNPGYRYHIVQNKTSLFSSTMVPGMVTVCKGCVSCFPAATEVPLQEPRVDDINFFSPTVKLKTTSLLLCAFLKCATGMTTLI